MTDCRVLFLKCSQTFSFREDNYMYQVSCTNNLVCTFSVHLDGIPQAEKLNALETLFNKN